MNLAEIFRSNYLSQVRDFLTVCLRDVDIIIPVENKGARLFEEATSMLVNPLKGRVFLPNAIPYLLKEDLDGKIIGVIDDSVLYGRNLKRVSDLIGRPNQVRCFAFAACDEPDAVEKRHASGLRIDSALRLRKPEYEVFISALSAFLRTRGHSLPVDNTTFQLHYSGHRLRNTWDLLLDHLARLGTVTETWKREAEGQLLTAALHFPEGFSPNRLGLSAIDHDELIKLRLFTFLDTGTVVCNPMAFVAMRKPVHGAWHGVPDPEPPLFREFRDAFSKFPPGEDISSLNAAYDQLGFYLDCELFAFVLGTLHETGLMPDRVSHDRSALTRYYGPHIGGRLTVVLDNFISRLGQTSVPVPAGSTHDCRQPQQGLAATAMMEKLLSVLREQYEEQSTYEKDPSKWKHRGLSLGQLIEGLGISRLEGSIFLDALCDAGHLVPFNYYDEEAQHVVRCYRAAEESPEERGKLIAYVIYRIGEVGRFKRDGIVGKTITQKAFGLLKRFLSPSALDVNIKLVRVSLGSVTKLMGADKCAEPAVYDLDNYPTQWYKHAEGGRDGYVPTSKFLAEINEASSDKFLNGLNADPYLDRMIKLLEDEHGVQLLMLMALLAGREFGLTNVTADVELGLRAMHEGAHRGVNNIRSIAKGRKELAFAREKLQLLGRSDLLNTLRNLIGERSITDKTINSHIVGLSPTSMPFMLTRAAVELADSVLERLSQNENDPQLLLGELARPALPVASPSQLLAELETIFRLGEPSNERQPDWVRAQLGIYNKIMDALYAAANVQIDFHNQLPHGTEDRYFLVTDLTNFTRLGVKLDHGRFRDLAQEAMNIVYSYGRLFGAVVAKPSEGDKAMLGFATRGQAVASAAFCFQHFAALGESLAQRTSFGIKCGLAAGECSPIAGGDLVSNAINVASRLCAGARGAGEQGGIVSTNQMALEDYHAGDLFSVQITSSGTVASEVQAAELDSAKICRKILDDLHLLAQKTRGS